MGGQAQLRAISVVEPFRYSRLAMGREHEGIEVEQTLRQRALAALQGAVTELHAGIAAEPELLDGSPVPMLKRFSADLELLVLGPRSYGTPGAVLLGPVARELVRCAACPVMVVPRAAAPAREVMHAAGTTAGAHDV